MRTEDVVAGGGAGAPGASHHCPGGIAQERAQEAAVQEMASLTTYCQRVRANLSSFAMDEKRLAIETLPITVP